MFATAYSFSPTSGEDKGDVPAQESPVAPGKFLRPLNATFVKKPPCGDRQIAVFAPLAESADERNEIAESGVDAWSVQHDWRQVPLFNISDGTPALIGEIGVEPGSDVTEKPRPSMLHSFQDGDWQIDVALVVADEKSKRDNLLAIAQIRIAPLQDAVDLGIATNAESAALQEWKKYRVDLGRIELLPGFPSAYTVPPAPDKAPPAN